MSGEERKRSAKRVRPRQKRGERTVDDLFEVVDVAALLEDVVESGDLNEPSDVVGEELVVDDPFGKLVPLAGVAVNCVRVSGVKRGGEGGGTYRP